MPHQITYEELYKLIEKMTPAQKQQPVKMYTPMDGELHPENETSRPEYRFSSKLVLAKNIYDDNVNNQFSGEEYKDQYVIMEYIDKETLIKLNCI